MLKLPKPRLPQSRVPGIERWSLEEFPNPNPLFPPPPRCSRKWTVLFWLLVFVFADCAAWVTYWAMIETDSSQFTAQIVLGSVLGFFSSVGGAIVYFSMRREQFWRDGKIFPAIADQVHQGLALGRGASVAIGLLVPQPFGVIVGALLWTLGASKVSLRLVEGGQVRRVRITHRSAGLAKGMIAWVIRSSRGRYALAHTIAPDLPATVKVPNEVRAWCNRALQAATEATAPRSDADPTPVPEGGDQHREEPQAAVPEDHRRSHGGAPRVSREGPSKAGARKPSRDPYRKSRLDRYR